MKKIVAISVLALSTLSLVSAYEMDMDIDMSGLNNLWENITNDVMWNMDKMMEDFWAWEDNFNIMMKDFQTKLESDLTEMTQRINSMMDGIMSDLDVQMVKLEADLNTMANELPEKIVWNLDTRLDTFFSKLDAKLDDDKYMESLNKLTDKIEELDNAWRFKTKILQEAVGYLWAKTEVQKNKIVQGQAKKLKEKNAEEVSKEDLKNIKNLFDWLESK